MSKSHGHDTLLQTLIGTFTDQGDEPPTIDDVRLKAEQLAPLLGFTGDVEVVVREALVNIDVRMGIGESLVDDTAADYNPAWVERMQDWTYSENYSRFLVEGDFNRSVVGKLEIVTRNILGLLQDPEVGDRWDRRGLVIGHVQSGKTANYLGLVARAADAGYKFIVVIAGIHNNLRSQTQKRVDEGFVGQSSEPGARKDIGVGLYPGHPKPVALTNVVDDFRKRDAGKLRSGIKDWSKPVVLVIKKNVSTLKQITTWLKDFNLDVGQSQIADVPMLVIDDEADNASVNTNKPELDPTTTNRLIREMLALFNKSCYVGYTATPFANIFIHPDAYDEKTREDLFPADFIYSLDAPTSYFGADKVFLDDESSERHVRDIVDAEHYFPFKHPKDLEVAELPESLKKAIRTFVLAKAMRIFRGQGHKHCSMLVNVSRFVSVQQNVRVAISDYLEPLRNAVQANYAMPSRIAMRNRHMSELHETFLEEYGDIEEGWEAVLPFVNKAAQAIRLFVVNSSKSDEPLDYAAYDKEGKSLTAIAIGGLSLSRGLTIEGLTVSYMYRNTKMYDTLMQMARWFGYRPNYEDLCRVWLSPASTDWYVHIARATEELRASIKQMRQLGMKPKQFGLRVESHPDVLMVTAANKRRHAKEQVVQVSYDGLLRETYILPASEKVNEGNRNLMYRFYNELGENNRHDDPKRKKPHCPIWRGVEASSVREFLARFVWHEEMAEQKASVVRYLDRIADRFPQWDVAFISLKGNPDSEAMQLGDFRMQTQQRSVGRNHDGSQPRRPDGGPGFYVGGKQRVAGTGDECVGLSEAEFALAERIATENDRKAPTDIDFRNVKVRGRPLLMLHLVDLYDGSLRKTSDARLLVSSVPALSVSFPASGEYKPVNYLINPVMIEQLEREGEDNPDEDEDYD